MFLPQRLLRGLFCLALVTLLVSAMTGCGGGGGGTSSTSGSIVSAPSPTLKGVSESHSGPMPLGTTQQVTLTGTYSDGTTRDITGIASWTSSNTSVLTVSSSGLLTAVGQGTANITISAGNITGTFNLSVGPPVLVSVSVSPASVTAMQGTAPKYTATATYTDHTTADVSSTVAWSVTNPFVVAVDASGKATPKGIGYAEVSASIGAINSNVAKFVGLAYPRYLLSLSDAGRSMNRATVDAGSGRIRWEGHSLMNALSGGLPCATTDPKQGFVYVTSFTDANHGWIDIRLIDAAKGSLTKLPPTPVPVAAPVRCLQFEPSGNFAYATGSYNNTVNQLLIFQKGAMGSISQLNSISLPSEPSDVAIDPPGKFLYVITLSITPAAEAMAYGYSIDPITGALTAIPGTPFQVSNSSGTFAFGPSGKYIYLSNTNGASIDAYAVNRQSGAITPAKTIQTCVNPSALVFSPSGDYAYATCSMDANRAPSSATVESFRVNADGSLTRLGGAPAVIGVGNLSIDPSGKFLYFNGYGGHLWSYMIDGNGLASLDHKYGTHDGVNVLVTSGVAPVAYAPKFAFVSSTGDNRITSYAVNTDGTFGNSTYTAAPTGPFSLTMVPWGSDLVVDSTTPNGSLFGYSILADGSLTRGGSNFGAATTSGGVLMDASGVRAVETDVVRNGVYTYEESSATYWGLLTYLPPGQPAYSLFPTGNTPVPLAMDAAGRFVFVGNQGSNSITAFHHWGTGIELLEATTMWTSPYADGSPYALGAMPVAMAVDPTGAWLYAVCGDQTLRVFAIDYSANGHLTQVASKALDGATAGAAVSVDSRFVYTADVHGLHAFSVNNSTGDLTEITLGSYATISNAKNVYADPAGKSVYVMTSASGSGSVLGFEIQTDGTLRAFSQNPLATPNQPSSMTFATDIK